MKIFRSPSINPDHDNFSLAGKAWKDRANGVTELSAQSPSDKLPLKDNLKRHEHQRNLLAAQLNAFINAAATPTRWSRTAIGNSQAPHMKVPLPAFKDARVLPSLSHARHASMKSFNESKAASKFTRDYLRCDPEVRKDFLIKLAQDIDKAKNNRQLKAKLMHLQGELLNLSEKKHQDIDTLAKRWKKLELRKVEADSKTGRSRMLAKAELLLKGTDGKMRSIERKASEILNPSTYELHQIGNRGEKVSNRPLHVEELKQRALGKSSGPMRDLKTEIEIRDFTASRFDAFAEAMRQFREDLRRDGGVDPGAEQALRDAAKPILYSRDRDAIHRFIRDMARQLKRADVAPDQLAEINALTADRHDSAWKLAQQILPGTGKQMRLQDEAERMAKALPKLLALLTTKRSNTLKNNLMRYDLSGVKGLHDCLDSNEAAHPEAVKFIASPQGRAFVNAVVKKAAGTFGQDHAAVQEIKEAIGKRESGSIPGLVRTLLTQLATANGRNAEPASVLQDLVNENRHLFMLTSDAEFWEREAVDKIGTRLVADQDVHARDKSRIFKQMKMRAAAIGMSKEEIDAFMIEGIGNTLRNRNMAISGSRLGGMTGMLPGALVGAGLMNRMKKKRLQEAQGIANAGPIRLDGDWRQPPAPPTYASAGNGFIAAGMRLFNIKEVRKSALSPSFRTGRSQFAQAQAQTWKGVARDGVDFLWKPARYAFYTSFKDAWKDLVIHNDPKQAGKKKAAYSPASTPAVTLLRSMGGTDRNKDLPDLPLEDAPELRSLRKQTSSTDSLPSAASNESFSQRSDAGK